MTSDDNPLFLPTNTYLCLLPLGHAIQAAGSELMDGRRAAVEPMLLFKIKSLKSASLIPYIVHFGTTLGRIVCLALVTCLIFIYFYASYTAGKYFWSF